MESGCHGRRSNGRVPDFRCAAIRLSPQLSRYPAEARAGLVSIACRPIFHPRSLSHRNWFRSAQATAWKLTDNCLGLPAAKRGNRPSSTFTAAARVRCCLAGIIDGNTRTTTEPINIWRAGASSCSRWTTGSASGMARRSSFQTTRLNVAPPSIATSLRPDVICSRVRTWILRRIGIWGASLGGYLTALALGRNSDVFAAGVDMHGVHDRLPAVSPDQLARAMVGDGITESDLRQALKVAYESSPISAVADMEVAGITHSRRRRSNREFSSDRGSPAPAAGEGREGRGTGPARRRPRRSAVAKLENVHHRHGSVL